MFRLQSEWFDRNRLLFTALCQKYEHAFLAYEGVYEEAAEHHDDPHEKKALRIAAWTELLESGEAFREETWLYRVWCKMKTAEWAKPGKYPRSIGDLGCPASLLGFRLTYFLKKAQSDVPVFINGGLIFFCKSPRQSVLRYVFSELIRPTHRYFFVYFSDDSCFSFRLPDGSIVRGNADISSCDSSHGPKVFRALGDLFPEGPIRSEAHRLINQCRAPVEVRSVRDRKVKVVLKPRRPVLYSGATITTAINNVANLSIAIEFSRLDSFLEADLIAAARRVGYIITVEMAPDWHTLQFLKHSPVLDVNGRLQPLLNLGVLLRLSGTCKGDLPGRGDMEPRARAFQKALLAGAYPRAHFPLVDRMKETVADAGFYRGMEKTVAAVLAYKTDHDDCDEEFTLTSSEGYVRYQLEHHEREFLDDTFGRGCFKDFFAHSSMDKILRLDYGLRCNFGPPVPPPPRAAVLDG